MKCAKIGPDMVEELPLKDLSPRGHIAIMKGAWGLIPKILDGTKTCESRWYKSKVAPWNKICPGDNLYFKNAGEPVGVKTKVARILQYEIKNGNQGLEIMKKHALEDLGLPTIPDEIKDYIRGKKYAIFVFFNAVEKIRPFEIDKTGFGSQAAWLIVGDIAEIKKDQN